MPNTSLKNQHFSPEKKLEILMDFSRMKNVSDVCLLHDINRTTLYSWIDRFEANGKLGLDRKSNTGSNHPLKTTSDIADQVIAFSIAHPGYGCIKIAAELKACGINISSPTVQKTLLNDHLGKIKQRVFRLEKNHVKEGWEISANDIKLISKNNPCFRHVNEIGTYPGEILVQDTFPVFGIFPDTYIYVVIDTYSYYSFAYPIKEKSAAMAVDVLNVKALMFFRRKNFKVKKILTSRGREFTKFNNQYTDFLNKSDITHEIYAGREKNWHGYIERYKQEFLERFDKTPKDNSDLIYMKELIQRITDDRINARKPTQGFPTFGVSPLRMVSPFER